MLHSLAEIISQLPLTSQKRIIAMANQLRNLKAQPNIEIENSIIYPQTPVTPVEKNRKKKKMTLMTQRLNR